MLFGHLMPGALAVPRRERVAPLHQSVIIPEQFRLHLPRDAVQIRLRRLAKRLPLDPSMLLRRLRCARGALLRTLKHFLGDARPHDVEVGNLRHGRMRRTGQ